MFFVVGFVVVGLVLAIAAVFVFREAARMSEDPPEAVFDPDDSYEWVVRHLPDVVAATLTPADVRRILDFQLEFANVAATPLGEPGAGWAALSKTLDQAAAMSSNEMVGGGQFVLDESVQYAKDRVQFGRPIGSFQAIKHKCADMLLEVESGKSAAYYAAWAAAEDNEELPVAASLAKAYCSDAYFHAAAENIQIHGGIGFTWEHDAHLYFKRAKSSEILLGDATYHRELLAQRIGI